MVVYVEGDLYIGVSKDVRRLGNELSCTGDCCGTLLTHTCLGRPFFFGGSHPVFSVAHLGRTPRFHAVAMAPRTYCRRRSEHYFLSVDSPPPSEAAVGRAEEDNRTTRASDRSDDCVLRVPVERRGAVSGSTPHNRRLHHQSNVVSSPLVGRDSMVAEAVV